jgi:hypothetical protein
VADADPDAHATVVGRLEPVPAAGLELNLHVDALDTLADRLTSPPEAGRKAGVAVNAEIDGEGVGATVTDTGVAWTFPPPLTTSLNV